MGIYGIVSGGVEVDSVTIDTNAEGELQVKNGLLNTFGYSSGEQIGEVILESQGVNSSTTDYVLTKTIQTSGNAFLGFFECLAIGAGGNGNTFWQIRIDDVIVWEFEGNSTAGEIRTQQLFIPSNKDIEIWSRRSGNFASGRIENLRILGTIVPISNAPPEFTA